MFGEGLCSGNCDAKFWNEALLMYFSILYNINKPGHEISNNVVYATSSASDQPAHTRSLIRAFANR